ncbi:GFA family protein [Sorangium sp. So ce118]
MVQCHCSMCRRASGSALATNAPVRADALVSCKGRSSSPSTSRPPGRRRALCSRCGSRSTPACSEAPPPYYGSPGPRR